MTITNEEAQDLFVQYGSAASEAMFDFPCHFFRIPHLTGIIAYRLEYRCAVIFGDPIASKNQWEELIEAFHRHCSELHLKVIYIIVSDEFATLLQKYCKISIEACKS